VRVTARVTNDVTATPRATLTDGLTSTSGGSASVPGCACGFYARPSEKRQLRLVSDVMCGDRIAWAANRRLKLTARGGRLEGNGSLLFAAAAGRNLSAIRWVRLGSAT